MDINLFYRAKNPHEAALLSRIEDQLIEKFNNMCKDNNINQCISQEELINILVTWAHFWYNERPITKNHSDVVEMKKAICDLRIIAIYRQAEKLGVSDHMPEMTLY